MIEAMKQALEALEQVTKELLAVRDELAERGARPTTNVFHQRLWDSSFSAYTDHAIPAAQSLRQAIREHAMYEVQRLGQEIEQEPVAWMSEDEHTVYTSKQVDGCFQHDHIPLYTHPPQRTWVGLTDEEIIDVIHPLVMADMPDQATDYEIAKAIEAKLKEKNNA